MVQCNFLETNSRIVNQEIPYPLWSQHVKFEVLALVTLQNIVPVMSQIWLDLSNEYEEYYFLECNKLFRWSSANLQGRAAKKSTLLLMSS
jgi:hypothetical protein